MQRFEIANLAMEIDSDKQIFFDRFSPFVSCSSEAPDLKIHINGCNEISEPEGKLIIDQDIKWVHRPDCDNEISIYACREGSDKIVFTLEADRYWKNIHITYLEDECRVEYAVTGILGSILFRNSILFHQGVVIHASAVEWNGRGILFSAPSGTGKSTQARLWKENMGARILNDDCPCIRRAEDKNYVYGTPWSGSSDEFINDCAPISAIIVLEQSDENIIQRLESNAAVSMLMPRCFLPFYNRDIMNLALNNFENIISSTPVYLLKCRPDIEAVELVHQCVK